MGLTITDKHGNSRTVTGADYKADKAGGHTPPATTQEAEVGSDTFIVPEKTWGPDNGKGLRHLLYHKGQRISMGEAIKAGLVKAQAEEKAAPKTAPKKRAATKKPPATPSDS